MHAHGGYTHMREEWGYIMKLVLQLAVQVAMHVNGCHSHIVSSSSASLLHVLPACSHGVMLLCVKADSVRDLHL
jgi:hypothetical protein